MTLCSLCFNVERFLGLSFYKWCTLVVLDFHIYKLYPHISVVTKAWNDKNKVFTVVNLDSGETNNSITRKGVSKMHPKLRLVCVLMMYEDGPRRAETTSVFSSALSCCVQVFSSFFSFFPRKRLSFPPFFFHDKVQTFWLHDSSLSGNSHIFLP